MRTLPLLIAAALCSAAPAAAQDSTAAPPAAAKQATTIPHKSATAATLIALIAPGAGHIYAGESGRGLALLGVGLGSVAVGTAVLISSATKDAQQCTWDNCSLDRTARNWGWFYAGAVVYTATYIYGIADAGSSANRMNARNARKAQLTLGSTTFQPAVAPTPQGLALGMRIGLGR